MSQMTCQGKSQMVYIMYMAGSSWFFWYKLVFKIKESVLCKLSWRAMKA